MQTFTAIPFSDWYKKYKRNSIFINLADRFVEVFNKSNESLGKLHFSWRIDSDFDIHELLTSDIPEGGFQYFVFPSEPFLADTLWKIQLYTLTDKITNLSAFAQWYKKTNSLSIELDFDLRTLKTFSKENKPLRTLEMSNSIDSDFDLIDLFNQNKDIGDYHYGVMENGYSGKDYLWRRKISITL